MLLLRPNRDSVWLHRICGARSCSEFWEIDQPSMSPNDEWPLGKRHCVSVRVCVTLSAGLSWPFLIVSSASAAYYRASVLLDCLTPRMLVYSSLLPIRRGFPGLLLIGYKSKASLPGVPHGCLRPYCCYYRFIQLPPDMRISQFWTERRI